MNDRKEDSNDNDTNSHQGDPRTHGDWQSSPSDNRGHETNHNKSSILNSFSLSSEQGNNSSNGTIPTNHQPEPPFPSVREVVGTASVQFSQLVNDHMLEARIVLWSTIGMFTVYGIARSPFFFRYRTVAEIPPHWFRQRKTIRGRLVRIWTPSSSEHNFYNATSQQHHGGMQQLSYGHNTSTNNNNSSNIPHRRKSRRTENVNPTNKTKGWNWFQLGDSTLNRNIQRFMDSNPESSSSSSLRDRFREDSDETTTTGSSTVEAKFATRPIYCMIRHASPVESLLPKRWYQKFIRWHPFSSSSASSLSSYKSSPHRKSNLQQEQQQQKSQTQYRLADQLDDQLLVVELQGIQSLSLLQPSQSQSQTWSSSSSSPSQFNHHSPATTNLEWLESLAQERLFVSCQLLGRRKLVPSSRQQSTPHYSNVNNGKNDSTALSSSSSSFDLPSHIAVGRIYYRSPTSVWDGIRQFVVPPDLALSLVQTGRVVVTPSDVSTSKKNPKNNNNNDDDKNNNIQEQDTDDLYQYPSQYDTEMMDTTDSVLELRADERYQTKLQQAQNQAILYSHGMWRHSFHLLEQTRFGSQWIQSAKDSSLLTSSSYLKKLFMSTIQWFRRGHDGRHSSTSKKETRLSSKTVSSSSSPSSWFWRQVKSLISMVSKRRSKKKSSSN